MKLVYDINDRPPLKKNLIFALQQLLAIMAATLLVPVLVDSTGTYMSQPAALFGAGVGTLFSRMKAGFTDTIEELKEGGENFLVWFVTNFIYLIIWAVIIIVGVVIIKKILKKKCMSGRKNKATTQEQEPSQTEEEENDRMDLKE